MKKWIVVLLASFIVLAGCGTEEKAEDVKGASSDKKEEAAEEPKSAENSEPIGVRVPFDTQDESDQDADLKDAIGKVKTAVQAKDTDALLEMVSEDVTSSFGSDGGKEAFMEEWQLDAAPEGSPFWNEAADILELGGAFVTEGRGSFLMPYVAARFPAEYDPAVYSVVNGTDVNLRSEPSVDSEVIQPLSNELVKMGDPMEETYEMNGRQYHWVPIETTYGTTGYMVEKFVRSPMDYRMEFSKMDDGAWKVTAFVKGD
ncbi:SH3 domain-containing protein [Bacillus marinisedimentorum]|uniref:SH3 domain-containing protein n=1 Tax=Bacillus marinisedimentorum TaxID=1821260 RepID=UPI0007E16296|nr:SH3 domain-containing protein [Bacillus marinisedimentorum]